MESYRTLAGQASATIVEKKSEFIGLIAPVTSDEQAVKVIEQVKAAHRTARHNVYAYSLRENARQRYSDDGEPAKTAGLPVLSVITHSGITDCIIVVTRYFGGVLLGTGGLVRAYTAAAQAALEKAEILTVQSCVTVTVLLEYSLLSQAQRIVQQAGAKMEQPEFTSQVKLSATLPAKDGPALVEKLVELCRGSDGIEVSSAFYTPF